MEVSSAILANLNFLLHGFESNFKKEAFNFDFQISPFIDFAFTDFKNWNFTNGIEFFVFPKKWSSYIIRSSFGYDIKKAFDEENFLKGIWKNKEIFLGLGFLF